MDTDQYVSGRDAEHAGDVRSEYLGDVLDFQVMVAGAQRAHLIVLALFGVVGDGFGAGAAHATALFRVAQVLGPSITPFHRPASAAAQHGVHLLVLEPQAAGTADPGGDGGEQGLRQAVLYRQDTVAFEAGMQGAYAAGNIKPHATGRDDTALIRIEGGHAADGKPVAPMGIGHGIGGLDDPGKGSHVGELFEDLVIHLFDERRAGVENRRNAHLTEGFDAPGVFRILDKAGAIHSLGSMRFPRMKLESIYNVSVYDRCGLCS